MAKIAVKLGSNTNVAIENRSVDPHGIKDVWITIEQGKNYIQTASSLAELNLLRDEIGKVLLAAGVTMRMTHDL